MSRVGDLWRTGGEADWLGALTSYENYMRAEVGALDQELDPLNLDMIRQLDAEAWYKFLHEKYFPWKYTAHNRLATTRRQLERHRAEGLAGLLRTKERMLGFDKQDIALGLEIVTSIHGLGPAGASGLLALMYPEAFGTVDEFLVSAISEIEHIPNREKIWRIASRLNECKRQRKSFTLSKNDAEQLITAMKFMANQLNRRFSTNTWTPRLVDKALWALGHQQ